MSAKLIKNDKVKVLTGKDKGKVGEVIRVMPKEAKVLVNGVNVVKKASKATKKNPQGGIIEITKPVDISNVALVCPSCGKATRVGFVASKKGAKDRVCKACNAVVKE